MLKPSDDFKHRWDAAKKERDQIDSDLKEILRFCAPDRVHDFDQKGGRTPKPDEVTTFTSLGEECATDLAGDIVNYYMPSETRWSGFEVTAPIPEEAADQVLAVVQAREDELFDMFDASNLNDIKPQIGFEVASHGTPALWVADGHMSQPISVEVIPVHEVYLTVGHRGYVDRFRKKFVMTDYLAAELPDMNLDQAPIRALLAKKGTWAEVIWGFWLDWSEPANPRWIREVTVDGTRVSEEREDIGPINGACPMLVGRFNPRPGRAWGRGPGWKALPDLLVLDKIKEVVLGKLDEQLDPAWTYVDDGVLNFDNGIVGGLGYPRKSDQVPTPLLAPANLDYGFFTEGEITRSIEKAFYQDGPRQRGDTPPSATQWVDERRRVQARLGMPSAPLFTELFAPLMQRFEALAVMQGRLDQAISLDGSAINIRPVSPLQRSRNQDKALISRSNIEFAAGVLGEQFGQVIDGLKTVQNHISATGDELTAVQSRQAQQTGTPPNDPAQTPT